MKLFKAVGFEPPKLDKEVFKSNQSPKLRPEFRDGTYAPMIIGTSSNNQRISDNDRRGTALEKTAEDNYSKEF